MNRIILIKIKMDNVPFIISMITSIVYNISQIDIIIKMFHQKKQCCSCFPIICCLINQLYWFLFFIFSELSKPFYFWAYLVNIIISLLLLIIYFFLFTDACNNIFNFGFYIFTLFDILFEAGMIEYDIIEINDIKYQNDIDIGIEI